MSVEFNVEAILRGDFLARMEGMSKAVASGLRTPNEARALDNLPPVEGGDVAYIQGAMMPLKNQQNAELVSKQDKNATGGNDGGED
jgi:phage portal protein BeeE